jgi:Putative peptidoglycan binding domain
MTQADSTKGLWRTIAQGDSVESLAVAHGLTTEKVWRHPENAPLRAARQSPHVLHPGDRLFLPPIDVRTEQLATTRVHRFERRGVPSRLRLRLAILGEPLRDEPFVLYAGGLEFHGQTDGDGWVDVRVPASLERGRLVVGNGDDAIEYAVHPRELDPCDEVTGWQSRLRNLGYAPGTVDGVAGAQSRAALAAFQQDEGLPATGEPDDATRARLIARHGS